MSECATSLPCKQDVSDRDEVLLSLDSVLATLTARSWTVANGLLAIGHVQGVSLDRIGEPKTRYSALSGDGVKGQSNVNTQCRNVISRERSLIVIKRHANLPGQAIWGGLKTRRRHYFFDRSSGWGGAVVSSGVVSGGGGVWWGGGGASCREGGRGEGNHYTIMYRAYMYVTFVYIHVWTCTCTVYAIHHK